MQAANLLVQSMARSIFQQLITYGPLKGGDGTGKKWDIENDVKLQEIIGNQGASEKRLFLCAKHTGAWLSVRGATVTSNVLSKMEFLLFFMFLL